MTGRTNPADQHFTEAQRSARDTNLTPEARQHVLQELFQTQQSSGAGFSRYARDFNADPSRMAHLGLPGLELVGFGQDHSVLTRSRDGKIHSYDPNTMAERPIAAAQNGDVVHSGSRFFQRNDDGSLNYTAKPGDTNWTIARDGLAQQTGRQPNEITNRDIGNYMSELQRANPGVNFNRLRPDQTVRIPAHAPDGSFSPSERMDRVAPTTGEAIPRVVNPEFRGLGADRDGQTNASFRENLRRHITTETTDGPNGSRTIRTSGNLNDGTFTSTPVSRTDQMGADGRLRQREMSYGDGGITMNLSAPGGAPMKVENVTRATMRFDTRSGGYSGLIETRNGQSYRVQYDANGQVSSYDRSPIATP